MSSSTRRRRGAPAAVGIAAATFITALGACSATAAQVDPRALVLRQADAPAGYVQDPPNTMLIPNAFESRGPEGRDLVRRSERLTGYRVTFIDVSKRRSVPRSVGSQASLFRSRAGARLWLIEVDRDLREQSTSSASRTAVALGDEGWLVAGRGVVLVFWRYRTAFATITTTLMSVDRALALARVQQRRIASALR